MGKNTQILEIGQGKLRIADAYRAVAQNYTLSLPSSVIEKIDLCQQYVERKIAEPNATYYGINTGFGVMCNVRISTQDLSLLQRNLLLSHAVGTGAVVPIPLIKLMLLLKAQSLSYGHSGVKVSTISRLLDFFRLDIIPFVPEQGSLGASGDLAPLSHLSLPLIGEGEVFYNNKQMSATQALSDAGLEPLILGAKEGLALINGTQFMSAYGIWCVHHAKRLLRHASLIAATSIEAYNAHSLPMHPAIHQVRAHKGQIKTAKQILKYLKGSQLRELPKMQVQDCYSFRCIPQVHGASYDAVQYAKKVVTREINAVTDNPLVFPNEDLIVSGGNFHGQPLALALDFLAIALAEIGSISERRIFKLLDGTCLPPMLTEHAGLHSGLMIVQYTAAALASQNKQLCTPASVDSIVTSNGQEDHVSMGANAATKCLKVLQNTEAILAAEWLCAAQALDFRKKMADNKKSSETIEQLLADFRKQVPHLEEDRLLYNDVQKSISFWTRQ